MPKQVATPKPRTQLQAHGGIDCAGNLHAEHNATRFAQVPGRIIFLALHVGKMAGFFLGWNRVDDRIAVEVEERLGVLALFGDDAIRCEWRVEHRRGEIAQIAGILWFVAHRGRCTDEADVLAWRLQAVRKTANQTCQIGSLRAVEGVELVNDEVLERIRIVAVPQL